MKKTFFCISLAKCPIFYNSICKLNCFLLFSGFLTLPTAYVTGNPVECVVHPDLWNKTDIWDPLGVGKTNVFEDQYEEEYIGYPIETVRL